MRDLPAPPEEARDARTPGPRAALARRMRAGRRWRGVLSSSSSLLRRIVFINLIGLGLMVGGVLYLNQVRSGLIDIRAEALAKQGEIIAIAIAEYSAASGAMEDVDPAIAQRGLRRLAQPIAARGRLFDRTGRLVADTRAFEGAPVVVEPLAGDGPALSGSLADWIVHLYDRVVGAFGDPPTLYAETQISGVTTQPEVYDALRGERVVGVHLNATGELIVAVSLPVQRFKVVQGALVLSTEGGDIDAIVQAERKAIVHVFLGALGVSVVLSALLAAAIARPLRRLAAAARAATRAEHGLRLASSLRFPDLSRRRDEIGALSGALRDMSQALDARIEGIERFAADVAHEIKTPLTSVRSAVETLRRTSRDVEADAAARTRLLAVIEQDVRRLDRLVTDISNASRLDAELAREAFAEIDLSALLRIVADVVGDPRVMLRLPARGLSCRGLEGRLAQVFINLVENALSFSPSDGIVSIAARSLPGGVEVAVEDDGPGMPEEKLEAIFERFYSDRAGAGDAGQGAAANAEDAAAALGLRQNDHSGLGLSIARLIVDAHDGRIWAENRTDRHGARAGARFVVQLPR
jgi:two-component system sensor histidine kinase ChvG